MAAKPTKDKKYKPPYKFVEIVWDDAASNSETWVQPKDVTAPEQVITRGWLIRDEPKFVTVASSVSNEDLDEDHVGNTIAIPRGMIETMRELKLTTHKAKKARVKDGAVEVKL
jgi:hypothetical protein